MMIQKDENLECQNETNYTADDLDKVLLLEPKISLLHFYT